MFLDEKCNLLPAADSEFLMSCRICSVVVCRILTTSAVVVTSSVQQDEISSECFWQPSFHTFHQRDNKAEDEKLW